MKIYFSIIVPNYNHHKFLKQRLESIFNQTFSDFEVILLDDASTDDSVKILKDYASNPRTSHLEINKENSGSPFKQWEKGIDLAKGKYVWIAESDDFCETDFLENILDYVNKLKESPGIIYAQSIDVDENGNKISSRINYTSNFKPNIWEKNFIVDGEDFILNFLKVKNVIPNASAVVFKRSLIKEGIFNEELLNMKLCGDWYFWTKLSQNSQVGFLSRELNYFRNHRAVSRNHLSHSRKINRLLEEAYIRKYLERNFDLDQDQEINLLYRNWFQINPVRSIFKKDFYKVKLRKTSYFAFIYKALQERK